MAKSVRRKGFVVWCALVGTTVPIVLMALGLIIPSHRLQLQLYYLLWPPSYIVLEVYPVHGVPLLVALVLMVALMALNGLFYAVVGWILRMVYGHFEAT
jgi:hypothetical protein